MRYEQLPPALKARVDAQIGRKPRAKRSRATATEGTTSSWRCVKCGTVYTTEASMNRSKCVRLEIVIETTGPR